MLLLLILCALGIATRLVNWIINNVLSAHIVISGRKFRLISLLACVNLTYFLAMLMQIQQLHREKDTVKHQAAANQSIVIDKVYKCYRSALMNFCSLILMVQVIAVSRKYEQYNTV